MAGTSRAYEQYDPSQHIQWSKKAVLVVDVVESVRLIEQDEEGAILRWLGLVKDIEDRILAEWDGRVVKSLGDGLLIEFDQVHCAVAAAFDVQEASQHANAGLEPAHQVLLRVGIEASNVLVGKRDIFGHGVNLAARLASLAEPGEIVVSAQVREALTADLDADVEDLGDCFLRHIEKPVRAYRLRRPGGRTVLPYRMSLGALLPTIAVIPFAGHYVSPDHLVIGDILAQEINAALSSSQNLHVISQLSTGAFRNRSLSVDSVRDHLNTDYVLSGHFRVANDRVILTVELAEAASCQVVWAHRAAEPLGALLDGSGDLIGQILRDIGNAVLAQEVSRARSQCLPTLQNSTLLIAAIHFMHRLSRESFDYANKLLTTLIKRGAKEAAPQAWLGKWHVLNLQQGWSADPERDAQQAELCTRRALDSDPDSSLALAIDGLVHTHLTKRHDIAQDRYDQATAKNPSDALAWLLKGTQHAFKGEGEKAVGFTQLALKLSPLDPHRYYYDSLAATAYLTAGQFRDALESAERSLRANRTHTSTLRAKAIAHLNLGEEEAARAAAQALLQLEPGLTISGWLSRSPSAPYAIGRDWAQALRQVGIPD